MYFSSDLFGVFMISENDLATFNNHMLGLKLPTDPRWVNMAKDNLAEILIDHAWCEQKAASSGISLIVNHPDNKRLVQIMQEVVAEEWSHFNRVVAEIDKRGFTLGKPRNDEYVIELMKCIRKGGSPQQQLVEKLLVNALIEARSAERFKVLANEMEDAELAAFYYELMISEAGHYRVFIEFAEEVIPKDEVRLRWQELLKQEAVIMASLGPRADRMH